MKITRPPQLRSRAIRLGGALVGMALALGGCQHDEAVTGSIPDDYKQRHPIAIEEQNRSIVVFVGHARGGLTAAQRADVMGVASAWLHEGTGAIRIDVPSGTPNARPVAETMREIQAMLSAAGVPPRGVNARPYQPEDKRFLPPIRLTYSKIAAVAGPCGLWPGGHRPLNEEQELVREQGLLQLWLRLSAQPRGDGRQSIGSRAAAAGNAVLHGAAHCRVREVSQGIGDGHRLS
ncbi:pilus biogenesis lipoprotein CpaD [Bradyrhizobium sp. LB1.3]